MLVIPLSSPTAPTITPYLIRTYSFDLNKELGNRTKRLKLSQSIKSLMYREGNLIRFKSRFGFNSIRALMRLLILMSSR